MSSKKILNCRELDVEVIVQCLDMLANCYSLITDDDILCDLHHNMLQRLDEISPSLEYAFNVDYAVFAYKTDN